MGSGPRYPPVPPRSGGVAWRGGGVKSPRASGRPDRSPNSSPPRASALRATRGASPDADASQATSRGLGPLVSPKPDTRRTRQASVLSLGDRAGGFFPFSAQSLGTLPTFSCPPVSRSSQLLAKWTPKNGVKGMGTVCCDPSEALPDGLTSFNGRDWDPEGLRLPRGMRRARASAAQSVLA